MVSGDCVDGILSNRRPVARLYNRFYNRLSARVQGLREAGNEHDGANFGE
jgi:hypothetical protein